MTAAELVRQGIQHYTAQRYAEAEQHFRRALATDANCADAWHMLGMVALEANSLQDAGNLIRRALELSPDRPQYLTNLSLVHIAAGDDEAAEACLRDAVRIAPGHATAWNNLCEVLKREGLLAEALVAARRAAEAEPGSRIYQSSRLYALNFDPQLSLADLVAEHAAWGRFAMQSVSPLTQHPNAPEPNRRLKIGYVSPDFREHAVNRFFSPILEQHDRAQFEVYLYAEVERPEPETNRLKSLADAWRSTVGLSANDIAAMIRSDGIDLLIDLAGHSGNNRLDAFALKPAPLQATFLGYPSTTGLPTVDYRITDAVTDPPGDTARATEALVRLPGCFFCFAPPRNAPAVSPSPVLAKGHLTLGCTHQLIKLNSEVFNLWRQVLDALPDAQLLLLRSSLTTVRQRVLREKLTLAGIPHHRVEFREVGPRDAYLQVIGEIDILLDAFPWGGHTTTCEALWMGVPTLTLAGERPTSRLSASAQTAVGFPEFIATSPAEFVEIARRFASDPERLAQIRRELRPRMESTLCDGIGFTRRLETTYRTLWQTWCAAQPETAAAPATPASGPSSHPPIATPATTTSTAAVSRPQQPSPASTLVPLLICAYKPRYLEPVLGWLRAGGVFEQYRVFVWDNGGAGDICAKYGVGCYGMRDQLTHQAANLGKALAMRHLVDVVKQALPGADCYVCMDDDVIVDRPHLDALVAAARRPGLGMIGPLFHPFNTVTPPDGSIVSLDPCPTCGGPTSGGDPAHAASACVHCGGSGKDPQGLLLRVYPAEDRTVKNLGKLAGTLFAVSKAAVGKLQWAPYLYPILLRESDKKPVVYWAEDAALDQALTVLGFTNGYLAMPGLTPAIHLPELNADYMNWKLKARKVAPTSEFEFR